MNLVKALKSTFTTATRATPPAAEARIRAGRAVLVDVRQPGEWESGVAEGAALLPLTDLVGARALWRPFLEAVGGREMSVYCAAGGRSAVAARVLIREGFRAANGGALDEWAGAGWPIVPPEKRNG
jgi:rhodanese-related sulfurtransferase